MAEQERQSDILLLALSMAEQYSFIGPFDGRAIFIHWPSVAERLSFIGSGRATFIHWQWQSDIHSLAFSGRAIIIHWQWQSDIHSLATQWQSDIHSLAEQIHQSSAHLSFVRADSTLKHVFIFCESGSNNHAHIYPL